MLADGIMNKLRKMFKRIRIDEETLKHLKEYKDKFLMMSNGQIAVITEFEYEIERRQLGVWWWKKEKDFIFLMKATIWSYNMDMGFWGTISKPKTFIANLKLDNLRNRYQSHMKMWAEIGKGIYNLHMEHNDIY